jgi:hypothetical protein
MYQASGGALTMRVLLTSPAQLPDCLMVIDPSHQPLLETNVV